MAMTFEDTIWNRYPIPKGMSVWSDSGITPEECSLTDLIESVVQEVGSDIFVTESVQVNGVIHNMPDDTVSIRSARLSMPFQGSRLVKYSWDRQTQQLCLRYFPAIVTYLRKLKVSDLGNLTGDQLKYVRTYVLAEMGRKELFMVKSIDMRIDNGQLDYSILERSVSEWDATIERLKAEIFVYSSKFN